MTLGCQTLVLCHVFHVFALTQTAAWPESYESKTTLCLVHGNVLKHARNNNNKKAATFYGQDMSGVKKSQQQHPATHNKVKMLAYKKGIFI